jgi:hypothetical protein
MNERVGGFSYYWDRYTDWWTLRLTHATLGHPVADIKPLYPTNRGGLQECSCGAMFYDWEIQSQVGKN